MTMAMILKGIEEKAACIDRIIPGENLGDETREMATQIKRLWKDGIIENYTNEFLKWANGYKINFQPDANAFRVSDCYNIHVIAANKREARAFAEWYMNA